MEQTQSQVGSDLTDITIHQKTEVTAPTSPVVVAPSSVSSPAQVDSEGTPFDPSRHATDDAGCPVKNKTGKWRKIMGRPSERGASPTPKVESGNVQVSPSEVVIPGETPGTTAEPEAVAPMPLEEAKLLAKAYVNMLDQAAILALGPDVTLVDEEKQQIESCTALVLQEYPSAPKPPPWFVLLAVVTTIYTPKFQKPVPKSRLQKASDWVSGLFGRGKDKQEASTVKEVT